MGDKLRKNAVTGIKWSAFSQISRQLIQYISIVILVGLITPDDFGLMAMAVIVIGFLEIFKDLGTGSAIIHAQNPSEELKSSIFWLNVLIGLVVTILIYFFSPFAAYIYGSERVEPILKALSITFLISGLSILQKSLLEKELSFRVLSTIELVATFIGFVVAVSFAVKGYGVWSLVFQSIVGSFTLTLLIWIFGRWRPGFHFKYSEIKSIAHFSLNLVGFNVVNFLARNGDYFLIGKYLGDRELGHYYLAYRIMLYPIQNITVIISRVLFPSFSKIQTDNEQLRDFYAKITNAIALISFPMMAGLAVVSYDFTSTFFGQKWDSDLVALLIIILAPIGALQSVISTVGNIYQAKGKTDWMLKWSLFYTTITVTGFIIGLKWGVTGVAVSYLITNLLLLYPVFAIPFRLVEYKTLLFFKSFSGNIFSVVAMVFILLIISEGLGDYVDPITRLIILILSGIIIYVAATFVLNKKAFSYLKHLKPETLIKADKQI